MTMNKILFKSPEDFKRYKKDVVGEFIVVCTIPKPKSYPCIAIESQVPTNEGELDLRSYYTIEDYVYPEDFTRNGW